MAWNTLTLDGSYLDGIDTSYFGHLRSTAIEASDDSDEGRRFKAARAKVKILFQGPKYLGAYVASFGVTAFFDALADNAALAGDLQQVLAHSYAWFRYTHDSQSPGDIDEVRAERQYGALRDLLLAMSQTVPVTIGAASSSAGVPVVYASASAMDTRGGTDYSNS